MSSGGRTLEISTEDGVIINNQNEQNQQKIGISTLTNITSATKLRSEWLALGLLLIGGAGILGGSYLFWQQLLSLQIATYTALVLGISALIISGTWKRCMVTITTVDGKECQWTFKTEERAQDFYEELAMVYQHAQQANVYQPTASDHLENLKLVINRQNEHLGKHIAQSSNNIVQELQTLTRLLLENNSGTWYNCHECGAVLSPAVAVPKETVEEDEESNQPLPSKIYHTPTVKESKYADYYRTRPLEAPLPPLSDEELEEVTNQRNLEADEKLPASPFDAEKEEKREKSD